MAGPFDDLVTGNLATTPEGMALRQRIALAQIGRDRKGYPKNPGEGLTAIGDAIGERMQTSQLYAQMAALERASAARGVPPAGLPAAVPAVPGSNDPSTGAQSAAPAPVQTADAMPSWWPGAQVNLPPPQATADTSPQLPPTAPPVQDAGSAAPADLAYPQTASLASPDTASDAPDPGIQQAPTPSTVPPDPALRQRVAQIVHARQGGPQQNPMLAGQSPASMPSTIRPDPALLGSPLEAADNPPRETDIQPVQVAETGRPSVFPPVKLPSPVKEPGMSADPVEQAPMEPRNKNAPFLTPVPNKPPRMADPGPEELHYMRAASDRYVLPSDQKMYSERAAELANQRKLDYDQAMAAYKTRDELFKTDQERQSRKNEIELNLQKLEDERQQRQRGEKFARVLGPGGWQAYEPGIKESYKNVAGLAQQNRAINEIRGALTDEKMFHGSTAELNTTRAKLAHAFGWPLDDKVPNTERFATLMAPIVAANRRMISGNQNISDKDVETALRASGGDPKLEKESLLMILDDLQQGSLATAVEHQRKLHGLTGAINEPDFTNTVYTQHGVPNMHQLIPQGPVDELFANPNTQDEFDQTFHTPGLARDVLRFRKPSNGQQVR